MKKRVLSALLVLCMACSMVSTVWATETNATSGAPEPASQTLNLDNEQSGDEKESSTNEQPVEGSSASSPDSTSSGSEDSQEEESSSSSPGSDSSSSADSSSVSSGTTEGEDSTSSNANSDSNSSSSSSSSVSSDSTSQGDGVPSGSEQQGMPGEEQAGPANNVTDDSYTEKQTTPPSSSLLTHLGLDTEESITINVFDYDTINYATKRDPYSGINSGINNDHSLKFIGDTGDEGDGKNKVNDNTGEARNSWTGNDGSYGNYGGGVRQGIVNNTLTKGYPTLTTYNNESLDYLFDDSTFAGKKVYSDANHLFEDDAGYYSYDSSATFATLEKVNAEQGENDFALYDVPRSVGDDVPPDHAQFLPFNTLTGASTTDKGYRDYTLDGGSTSADHHFGMTVEFDFNLVNNGTVNDQDMIFSFSGDDDVWVFIDDVLVLDMGGIHNNYQGTINFASGEVNIERVWENNSYNNDREKTTTIKAMFEAAGQEWNGANNTTHTLKFFYLERGAGGSNCQLRFNIQPLPAGDLTIAKAVNADAPADQDYTFILADDDDVAVTNLSYDVYGQDSEQPVSIGNVIKDGKVTLKAGQTAVIKDFYTEQKGNLESQYTVTEDVSALQNLTNVVLGGGASRDTEKHKITVDYHHSNVSFTNNFTKQIDPQNLENDKYVTLNKDGTYDLSLNVSGAVSSDQTNNPIDVIFVLDTSSSMDYYMDKNENAYGYNWTGYWSEYEKSRIYNATNAIKQLATSLSFADARFALIEFESLSEGATDFGESWNATRWTESASALAEKLPVSFVGTGRGTNYEDPLLDAKSLLKDVRENAKVVVVFVSDGNPGYYNTSSWPGYGGSASGYNETAMDRAQIVVSQMAGVDYFFTVGVGSQDNYDKLSNLTNEDDYPDKDNSPWSDKYTLPAGMTTSNLYGENSEQLQTAFDEIKTTISTNLTTGVTITDILSNNVEIVKDENDQPAKLVVTVTDRETGDKIDGITGNGTSATVTLPATENNEQATLTAQYVEENDGQRKLILDFPDGYKLEPNYTYTITAKIDATEAAYQAYRNNNNEYPDTSTATRGNHAGEKGVFTNDGAKVTYDGGEKEYPKPVIQLHPKTLTITKAVEGLDTVSDEYKQALTFTVEAGAYEDTIQLSKFTSVPGQTNKFTYTIKGLSPNAVYTVSENADDVTVPNYVFDAKNSNADAKTGNLPAWNDDKTVTTAEFTNKYQPSDHVLTVTKTVDGAMGDTTANTKFTFALTLYDESGEKVTNAGELDATVNDMDTTLTATNGVYTFQLAHDQNAEITIPSAYTASVVETEDGGYSTYFKVEDLAKQTEILNVVAADDGSDKWVSEKGYTKGKTASEIAMTADRTVHFVNYRGVVAPTGLESNHTKPYALMITAAGIAGLALIGSIVARRVRRRREE